MASSTLTLPKRKAIRARVIARYVYAAGYPGVVCFSCGNAARALREAGLWVVEVGPCGELRPGKWWTPAEIHKVWPGLLDATSGHLPIPLMIEVARALQQELGDLGGGKYRVPTGSGETITCLRWAYPAAIFEPMYGLGAGTERNPEAPLNEIVAGMGLEPRLLTE